VKPSDFKDCFATVIGLTTPWVLPSHVVLVFKVKKPIRWNRVKPNFHRVKTCNLKLRLGILQSASQIPCEKPFYTIDKVNTTKTTILDFKKGKWLSG
jgi:hypothetical protein